MQGAMCCYSQCRKSPHSMCGSLEWVPQPDTTSELVLRRLQFQGTLFFLNSSFNVSLGRNMSRSFIEGECTLSEGRTIAIRRFQGAKGDLDRRSFVWACQAVAVTPRVRCLAMRCLGCHDILLCHKKGFASGSEATHQR